MSITIREKDSGTTLAEAEVGPSLAKYEGHWYFDPAAVRSDLLRVTERTYTCPYKGICYWIDIETPDGQRAQNIAWVYRQPKPGYEFITDQIGFYARATQGTLAERTGDQANHAATSLAK